MVQYKKADVKDIEVLMNIRLEMLRVVNNMGDGDEFASELVACSRDYFLNGDQTTVLAVADGKAVGCASISYINIMPTFSHPTGKRAHLMNVYTNKSFRRQGIAEKMIGMLIKEAMQKGITEISLDATEAGRLLYEKIGFTANNAGMVYEIQDNA